MYTYEHMDINMSVCVCVFGSLGNLQEMSENGMRCCWWSWSWHGERGSEGVPEGRCYCGADVPGRASRTGCGSRTQLGSERQCATQATICPQAPQSGLGEQRPSRVVVMPPFLGILVSRAAVADRSRESNPTLPTGCVPCPAPSVLSLPTGQRGAQCQILSAERWTGLHLDG